MVLAANSVGVAPSHSNLYLEGLSQADLRSADLGRKTGHGCTGSPSPIFSLSLSAGSRIKLSIGVRQSGPEEA